MTVRRLGPEDADAFFALRCEALETTPGAFGEDHADARARSLLEYANRLEYNVTFGAFAGEALTGILTYIPEEGPKVCHRAWLLGVYVTPAARGTGAATALLSAALEAARAEGVLQLELHVSDAAPRAISFYTREGFEIVGRSPRALYVDGIFHDELHMMRRLDA